MTPNALRLARHLLATGKKDSFDMLCQFQFFDCEQIWDHAQLVSDGMSLRARLMYWPANNVLIETKVHEDSANTSICIQLFRDKFGKNYHLFSIFFRIIESDEFVISLGTISEAHGIMACAPEHLKDADKATYYRGTVRSVVDQAISAMQIITTPRLVLMREHIAKPRRVKGCGRMIPGVSWNTVTIDPQATISPRRAEANGPSMPLHFVHGYHKPSLGKFIEGHWRGAAELGIRLHTYEVKGA